MPKLLQVINLHVAVGDKDIIKGVGFEVDKNEVHALMGPNGSGKSTLASVLAGHPSYTIKQGSIILNGQDITSLKPEERSVLGLFLAWQYPVSVSGLTVEQFLRSAVNSHRRFINTKELSIPEFREIMLKSMEDLHFNVELAERSLNDGFSGGEKKRLEILQLLMLKPKIAILDETDSGLDVDAMNIVAKSLSKLQELNIGLLVITHYQKLLHYLKPTHVHIMVDGKIITSGGPELASKIDMDGYDQFGK